MKSNQNTAWCNNCDGFIKNISQGKPPQIFFGKYKDRFIASMTSEEEITYLKWVEAQPWCKNLLRNQISTHLAYLKTQPSDYEKLMDDYEAHRGTGREDNKNG